MADNSEEINELSKKTLVNYTQSAVTDKGKADRESSIETVAGNYDRADAADRRSRKRYKGILKATNKLAEDDLQEGPFADYMEKQGNHKAKKLLNLGSEQGAKLVKIVNGKESTSRENVSRHSTIDYAIRKHKDRVALNPGVSVVHNLYFNGKFVRTLKEHVVLDEDANEFMTVLRAIAENKHPKPVSFASGHSTTVPREVALSAIRKYDQLDDENAKDQLAQSYYESLQSFKSAVGIQPQQNQGQEQMANEDLELTENQLSLYEDFLEEENLQELELSTLRSYANKNRNQLMALKSKRGRKSAADLNANRKRLAGNALVSKQIGKKLYDLHAKRTKAEGESFNHHAHELLAQHGYTLTHKGEKSNIWTKHDPETNNLHVAKHVFGDGSLSKPPVIHISSSSGGSSTRIDKPFHFRDTDSHGATKNHIETSLNDYARHTKNHAQYYPHMNENEEINELSRKTLSSYVNKSATNLDKNSYWQGVETGLPDGGPKVSKFAKKAQNRLDGIKTAAKKLSEARAENFEDIDLTEDQIDMLEEFMDENEINELSTDTLGSYWRKSAAQMDAIKSKRGRRSAKDKNTLAKRSEGIQRANSKLADKSYAQYSANHKESHNAYNQAAEKALGDHGFSLTHKGEKSNIWTKHDPETNTLHIVKHNFGSANVDDHKPAKLFATASNGVSTNLHHYLSFNKDNHAERHYKEIHSAIGKQIAHNPWRIEESKNLTESADFDTAKKKAISESELAERKQRWDDEDEKDYNEKTAGKKAQKIYTKIAKKRREEKYRYEDKHYGTAPSDATREIVSESSVSTAMKILQQNRRLDEEAEAARPSWKRSK